MNVIFLDTETTHLGDDGRLVQLAYKDMADGEELHPVKSSDKVEGNLALVGLFDRVNPVKSPITSRGAKQFDRVNEYFKPPRPIDYGSMAVHHITWEMVADKESFEGSETKQKLKELLAKRILVAHNARFDIAILKNEGVETGRYIDTLRLSQHLIESEQYGLQYLRYFLGLKVEAVAHDAWGDILVLEKLFNYLVEVIKQKFSFDSQEEIIQKMIELTQLPILLEIITFGKYKGKTFKEIAVTDRGYLQWLYNSETQKSELEQKEELVYTLKIYLR